MPSIQGTVKDANGNFARRLVRAHRRDTGSVVSETLSNPSTGTFTLATNDATKHYAVVHDSDAWITYLPFNGDNNTALFYEWGGKPVSVFGNSKISTTQSKFGGAACYLDGAGDYLSMPISADLAFGTADFSIEAFVRLDSLGVERAIFDNRAATSDTGLYFCVNSSNQLAAFGNNAAICTGTTALTATTWHHVALVKYNGTITLYLNGVSVASAASSYTITCPSAAVIGRKIGSTTNDFIGYIDDLVIQKGKAQYIANFTPRTAPFFTEQAGDPWWNLVVFGCHFNSGETPTFKDIAAGKTITAAGNVAISSAQSKFGGYSAFFDGSGDSLSVANSGDFTFSADFTFEFFVRFAAGTGVSAMIYDDETLSQYGILWQKTAAEKIQFSFMPDNAANKADSASLVALLGTTSIALNTWYHVAVSRVGTTIYLFVNGNLEASATVATGVGIHNPGGAKYFGVRGPYGTSYVNGYLDDVRVTKAVGRYSAAFTTPAAAFSELVQTFGQQNAMIYDHLTPV